MSVDLVLKNGIVILEGQEATRSVAINTGKIDGIYENGSEPSANRIIDCDGAYVLPGAIDIHVHLRDLNQSAKEDYRSGTKAAAAGGVTTVVDMPNSSPPTTNREILDRKIERAKLGRHINIGFYAGIPLSLSEFDHEIRNDILGLKVYPHTPLEDGIKYDAKRLRKCFELARSLNLPLLFHPDASHPRTVPKTVEDFFEVHSCESETISLSNFLNVHREIGGRLHVCHVSCRSTARMIIENRAEDRLTAEVTPHHLLLSGESFSNKDGSAKMLPPLRSPYDNQFLKDSLCKCGIDVIASDHAPHTPDEKNCAFLDAKAGIPGLETTVPLMLTEVFENRMSWVEYLRVCSSGPANILGLVGKGVLSKGYDADLIVVSKESWVIKGSKFHSKAKITPFEGREVLARPITTIVGGTVVFSEGRFQTSPGTVGAVPVRSLKKTRKT